MVRSLLFPPVILLAMVLATACGKDEEEKKYIYVSAVPIKYMGDQYTIYLLKSGDFVASVSGSASSGSNKTIGGELKKASDKTKEWTSDTTVDALRIEFFGQDKSVYRINGPFDFGSKNKHYVSFEKAVKQ